MEACWAVMTTTYGPLSHGLAREWFTTKRIHSTVRLCERLIRQDRGRRFWP
jgi:hypothetical protein